MKIGRIGKIENKGGIINFGEITGNVTAGINEAYRGVESKDDNNLEKIHKELLKLIDLINSNNAEIQNPEQTLKRVGKLSEEVFSDNADQTLIERYLELIGSAVSKVPSILKNITLIKSLIIGLF